MICRGFKSIQDISSLNGKSMKSMIWALRTQATDDIEKEIIKYWEVLE